MTFDELNDEQIDILRHAYFYQLQEMDEDVLGNINDPYGIPIENIKYHYEGIYFVDDDFRL